MDSPRPGTKPAAAISGVAAWLALLLVLASPAPAADHRGRDFWFVFPANYVLDNRLTVAITAPSSASGTVTVPGIGFSQAFTVAPGQPATVVLLKPTTGGRHEVTRIVDIE